MFSSKMIIILFDLFIALFYTSIVNAQNDPEKKADRFGVDTTASALPEGLKPGDTAPDFTVTDQNGKTVHLYDLLKKNKVVLFFYRGNWCPYCNEYLRDMRDSASLILATGASIIALSPENTENILKTDEKLDPGFSVAHASNSLMEAYDVLFDVNNGYQRKLKFFLFMDLADHNGQEKARLPVPATYVIDTNKKILYSHFDFDFKRRAPVKTILEYLAD